MVFWLVIHVTAVCLKILHELPMKTRRSTEEPGRFCHSHCREGQGSKKYTLWIHALFWILAPPHQQMACVALLRWFLWETDKSCKRITTLWVLIIVVGNTSVLKDFHDAKKVLKIAMKAYGGYGQGCVGQTFMWQKSAYLTCSFTLFVPDTVPPASV